MISCEVVSVRVHLLGGVTNWNKEKGLRTCREKYAMGFFGTGSSGRERMFDLDVEHPCEGSDRLAIPESLPN